MDTQVDLHDYDHYIVAFSGGKDSIASLITLIDAGIPKNKIELWHHLVDGEHSIFMDWPCTKSYCEQIAHLFGIKIFFSWKDGGFEREMTRQNTPTAKTIYQIPAIIAPDHLRDIYP